MSEKQALLNIINSSGLAMYDAALFLDSHPDNQAAMNYFQQHKAVRDQATKEYSMKYGPLTVEQVESNSMHWTWVDNPWPWQYEEEK
ncbi:MAG: spore coat protein CotJB [Bacillota bacterium]|nr:spore coat protein CotJB [Bacillota bacterium]